MLDGDLVARYLCALRAVHGSGSCDDVVGAHAEVLVIDSVSRVVVIVKSSVQRGLRDIDSMRIAHA
jgi:hypothetical protein